MTHRLSSHCIMLGLKTQGHTSVSQPMAMNKGSRPSKWKSSVRVFPSFHLTRHIIDCYEHIREKILSIELIVFHWLLKGNTLLLFFSSEDGFFISSINGRKTIWGLLNDPVCCTVPMSNGFYFPWMPSISKCPSEMKHFFSNTNFPVTSVSHCKLLLEVFTHVVMT